MKGGKEMKFNLGEVMSMQQSLNTILALELPVKPAYWLSRFADKIQAEMQAMEKARMKLIEKYAKKDKDGKPMMKKDKDGKPINEYDLTKANTEKFQLEFAELGKEEFEIDFEPIKFDQLGDIKLKPFTLVQLGKIITE